jgi:glutaredoxin
MPGVGCGVESKARFRIARNAEMRNERASQGPGHVTLYTRPGCHLCEEAKKAIEPVLAEFGAVLREINIDEDAALRQRYGQDVPVIFIGQHKAAKHRVDLAQFRRQLQEAMK